MNKPHSLTIVCPCFNEASCVAVFAETVEKCLPEGITHDFVFVDDGSQDDTLRQIRTLQADNPHVHYVSFSRNFGKEAALLAGFRMAKGDLVVSMDADLQDPPSLLPDMIAAIDAGYDCAATRCVSRRGDPAVRSWFAQRFYAMMRRFSDVPLVDGARDFRLMTRPVVEAILSMPEVLRFTKGIYQWVGFKTKWFEFENTPRVAGATKWNFWKLLLYALDGLLAFTTLPLQIASWLGILSCMGSLIALLWIFFKALMLGNPVAGWPSMVCIMIFLGGLQLFGLGIVGAYLARVYQEVKRRPSYLIRESA